MVTISDEGKRECPTCGAKVDATATECPECGEVFEAAAAAPAEEAAAEEAPAEETAEEYEEPAAEAGGKGKFFAGILLMLVGGPGIALGSYLHNLDALGAPLASWKGYGPIDTMTGIVGIVVMIVGIILVWKSGKSSSNEEWEEEQQ